MKLFQAFAGLLLFLFPNAATACTCSPPVDALLRSDVAVIGTIVEDELDGVSSPFGPYTTRLIPDRVLLGPRAPAYRLIQHPLQPFTTCGGRFVGKIGEKVLVGLAASEDGYSMLGCGFVSPDQHAAVIAGVEERLSAYAVSDYGDVSAWRRRAFQAAAAGHTAIRYESLLRIIELSPMSTPEVLNEAAEIALKYRQLDHARVLFEKALSIDGGSERARTGMTQVALRRGYDKELWSAAKRVAGVSWSGISPGVQLEGVTIGGFEMANVTVSRLDTSRLSLGQLRNVRFDSIRNVTMEWVLARKVAFTRLERAYLSGWRIDDGSFERASFNSVQVQGEIWRSSFRNANLVDVDMRQVNLTDVDFTDAGLYSVRFDRSRLKNVELSRLHRSMNLTLNGVHYDCATRLPGDLDPVAAGMIAMEPVCDGRPNNRDFTGTSYRGITAWSNMNLDGAKFTGVQFGDYADFGGSSLRDADFSGVRFSGSFASSDLRGAVFSGATLSPTFYGADLRNVDLRGATLQVRGGGWRYIDLRNAKHDDTTRWPDTYLDDKGQRLPFVVAEHAAGIR